MSLCTVLKCWCWWSIFWRDWALKGLIKQKPSSNASSLLVCWFREHLPPVYSTQSQTVKRITKLCSSVLQTIHHFSTHPQPHRGSWSESRLMLGSGGKENLETIPSGWHMPGDHCFDALTLFRAGSPLSLAFVPSPGVQMWSQLDVTIQQSNTASAWHTLHSHAKTLGPVTRDTHSRTHTHTLWPRGHLLPTAVRFLMDYISSNTATTPLLRPMVSSSLQEVSQCVCMCVRRQRAGFVGVRHVLYEFFFFF